MSTTPPRKVIPLLENPEKIFEKDSPSCSQSESTSDSTAEDEEEADKADQLRASVPAAMKAEVMDAVHTYKSRLLRILDKHKSDLTPEHDEKFMLHMAGFYQIANRSTARGSGLTAFSIFSEHARRSELADFNFDDPKSFEEYGKRAGALYRSLPPEEKEMYEKLAEERRAQDPGCWEDQRKTYYHNTTRQWTQQMKKAETMGFEVIMMITDNYRTHLRKALGTIGGVHYYNNRLAPVNWGVEGFDDYICSRSQEIALLYFLQAQELKCLPAVYAVIDKETEKKRKAPVLSEDERSQRVVHLSRKGGLGFARDDYRREVTNARLDFLAKFGIFKRLKTPALTAQKKEVMTRVPSVDAFRASMHELGKGLLLPRNMDARQIFWNRPNSGAEAKFLVDLLRAAEAVKIIDAPVQEAQRPARTSRSSAVSVAANHPAPRTIFYYSGDAVVLPSTMALPPGAEVLL